MYPCPCGYSGDLIKECICSNQVITRHQLDRLGIGRNLTAEFIPCVGNQYADDVAPNVDLLCFLEESIDHLFQD